MKEPQFNKAQNETSMKESEIPSVFSDDDLYLFGQGKEYRIYEKMGAHVRNINGVMGTSFATWAPNASAVSVIGDFNDWRRDANPMHVRHHENQFSIDIERDVGRRTLPVAIVRRNVETRGILRRGRHQ